ncbi:MAG: SLC13 family permease [Phycisphaerales bacterium]
MDGVTGNPSAVLAVACVAITIVALARGRMAADMAMAGGVALLILTGVLKPAEAFSGLASPSILTIALLLVVSQGVIETGLIQWIGPALFGRARSAVGAQLRLMLPVGAMSAFINNTPLVAMCIPVVQDFSRRSGIAPGKLFMPLAYAATLGGVCTLIGTSTNLVVNEMWVKSGERSFGLFDLAPVGIPVAIAGAAYIVIAARWLLPARGGAMLGAADARSYSAEVRVVGAPIAGNTVEGASLRGLEGLYLAEIERGGDRIAPVEPTTRLLEGDRLYFVGDVRSVVSLHRMRGLAAETDQKAKLQGSPHNRFLVEVVVSDTNPLLGRTIRAARFRSVYDAVVIAVSRNGARLENVKIGSIVIQPGDVLLLETQEAFLNAFADSRDFLLARRIEDSAPVRHDRAWIAALIACSVVAVAAPAPFGFTMFHAALAGALAMVGTRCCTGAQARKALNARLIFTIAGSLALGAALDKTGVAKSFADQIIALSRGSELATLAAIYLVTFILTELLSNATAAALVFPIAIAAASGQGIDPKIGALLVMVGASASFATPIGYQTNLMVQGPGGYRFSDYVKFGLPLGLLTGVVAILAVQMFLNAGTT